jgi:glycosyltransferase involved in cell wall biosynthesis
MPKISIVMPSYLGDYQNAAKDRDKKIVRAIRSVYKNTFQDWELILVSDGCEKTASIYEQTHGIFDDRLRFFQIERGKLWGGSPRNYGIEQAKGEWITYLDIDDYIGSKHLEIINKGLKGDWIWYDDLRFSPKTKSFYVNPCELKLSKCGTSNITHKKGSARWSVTGYAHDYHFIQALEKESKKYYKAETPEYYVCHIPKLYDI